MFCGVDEAGRGPVLGPLVVASVGTDDDEELRKMGVKDSKQLSPKHREELFHEITASYPYYVVIRESHEIDQARQVMNLNELEILMFAEAIAALPASQAFVDCADVNEMSFGRRIEALIPSGIEVRSFHKADVIYPVVSAASIVAKVTRDRLIEQLSLSLGMDVGSGYPSDPRTIRFLEKWIKDNGNPPSCARASWETTRRLIANSRSTKITDW